MANGMLPAAAVSAALQDLIEMTNFETLHPEEEDEGQFLGFIQTTNYRAAGILTNDDGFVLAIGNDRYQITVVKSR